MVKAERVEVGTPERAAGEAVPALGVDGDLAVGRVNGVEAVRRQVGGESVPHFDHLGQGVLLGGGEEHDVKQDLREPGRAGVEIIVLQPPCDGPQHVAPRCAARRRRPAVQSGLASVAGSSRCFARAGGV